MYLKFESQHSEPKIFIYIVQYFFLNETASNSTKNRFLILKYLYCNFSVTPRQRQEIYALNRVMTRLENEKFKKFCHEKGFKGDSAEKERLDYDIFM